MLDENNKTVAEDNDTTFSSMSECEAKIEKLNKKLQATADELEEISRLYAKSVKESLDKSKRIKELEDKIDELKEQLKECQTKREELEKQLKECQNNKAVAEDNDTTFSSMSECEAKIEKLNKKLQATADELEEISRLYAKSVKESLDKSKRIKELEDKIDELKEQLKECQTKREELEKQLKECQNNKAEPIKKIMTSRQESKVPSTIYSIGTDSKGNVYVGTRYESWIGVVFKCLAGESKFTEVPGTKGKIWAIASDKDENIYVGTTEAIEKGSVYKCLANENSGLS